MSTCVTLNMGLTCSRWVALVKGAWTWLTASIRALAVLAICSISTLYSRRLCFSLATPDREPAQTRLFTAAYHQTHGENDLTSNKSSSKHQGNSLGQSIRFYYYYISRPPAALRLTLLVGFHGELFSLLHGDLFSCNLIIDGREVFLR